jgi:DNA-binding transcriptional MerR regulator/predicted transcriptional regulator YdeE
MISIGDFARIGRVSVRMLRHYDAIGLLSPEHVDPYSSYRYYRIEQLRRLNRIVALKELGLRLDQVRDIVDERLDSGDLHGMLRLRQAEIESQILQSEQRLARVRRVFDSSKWSRPCPTLTSPQGRASHDRCRAEGVAGSATRNRRAVIRPMYPQLMELLGKAGTTPIGPSVAYYTPAPEESEDAVWVHATFPVPVESVAGLETVEVPAATVASVIHHGSMESIDAAYQTLHLWVQENDLTATGYAREVYLEVPDDVNDWVTEIQLDLAT